MRKVIDKKACRKVADPKLCFRKDNGLLHCEQVRYVVRTAVKNISGTRTLVLYIYEAKKVAQDQCPPLFTVFQTREDFATLKHCDSGSNQWRTSTTGNLNRDCYFTNKCAFYTPRDEKRVLDYCQSKRDTGFGALSWLQHRINDRKELEQRHKRQQVIVERMKDLPHIPRDLKGFIQRESVQHFIFYTYHTSKKPMEGYCTGCKHDVQVSGAKHNENGICPRCGRKIIFKSRGKRGYISERGTVQVMQRLKEKEIIIRFFKYYYTYYRKEVPQISVYENSRVFVSWDENGKADEEWYHTSYQSGDLTPWKKGQRPTYIYYQYSFEGDMSAHLYYRNLDEVLIDTPWQYSQLSTYYRKDPTPLYLLTYLTAYQRYPMIEYLVKLGLIRLATYVAYEVRRDSSKKAVNLQGRNIKEVLGVGKEHIPFLKEVDPGGQQLIMIRQMINKGIPLNKELLKWCSENRVGKTAKVLHPLKYMTAHKLMRYADEQFAKFRRKSYYQSGHLFSDMDAMLSDYCDYICMCDGLDYDLKNEFVLFPRNLPEAHHKVNELSDKEVSAAYDNQIAKAFSEMQRRYQFCKAGLMIVPPHSGKEIVEEGHKLHHCVGSYVKKVVNQDSVILFVRREEKPEEPYCTVEIVDGDVNQARGYSNSEPPARVQAFLSVWKNEVLFAPALDRAA